MYFHTYKADPAPLNVDIVGDIRRLNDMSVKAKQAGMIVLGGGVCKHQIANAMLFVSRPVGSLDLTSSATVPITPSTSTPDRSTMVPILVLVQTRLSRGARSAPTPRASRCV